MWHGGSRGGGAHTPVTRDFSPRDWGVAWRKAPHTYSDIYIDFLHSVCTGEEVELTNISYFSDVEERGTGSKLPASNWISLVKWGPSGDPRQYNGDPKSACFHNLAAL